MLKDPLIIALDFETAVDAHNLVRRLGQHASFYKVGLELFTAAGPAFVEELVAAGKRVFLDLKFFDIGATVERATKQVSRLGATFLTIHGSTQVMRAAIAGRADSPLKLLAVTVLTSFDQQDLCDYGYQHDVPTLVHLLTDQAVSAGVDGVIASPLEAAAVRVRLGPERLLVTPGVRSCGAAAGDQKRAATPQKALRDGADYLVIGRQITRAPDPVNAMQAVRNEIASA